MEVRTRSDGFRGVFALKTFSIGDELMQISGDTVSVPTRHTVQVGKDKHIVSDGLWSYLNHHCMPNSCIEFSSPDSLSDSSSLAAPRLVATKPISAGSEIVFDYLTTEWEMCEAFTCSCCGNLIRGAKYLTLEEIGYRMENLAPFIIEKKLASVNLGVTSPPISLEDVEQPLQDKLK